VPRAAAEGRYVVADAHEVLSSFMVDGVVDSDRFNDAMGDLLRPAGERHIRIFGEMVSVLWDEGNITAAIALESCWNDLATHYDFSLYCAYAMSSFECAPDLAALRDVCDLHSGIVAPDRYADVPSAASSTSADETISEFFLPVPLAIRAVRQFVQSTLVDWGATELLEDAAIVASELATNAVRHARSPFRVSMSRTGSTFKLMVHDGSDDSAQAQPFTADAEGGRGLTLVAALCPAWGTEYVADGKIVWAELAAH
jgi:Histidine kinase-like ATPase domain/MEDS: MEthanogen/methylotroph, DcmR Sensory domain